MTHNPFARQLGGRDTIRSFFSSSDANFYELSGILPIWSKGDTDVSSILDVTTLGHPPFERRAHSRLFARGVARGCNQSLLESLQETLYLSENTLLYVPARLLPGVAMFFYLFKHSRRGYPRPYLLPLSHPQFFRRRPPRAGATASPARVAGVPAVTLLSQTRALAALLDTCARGCRAAARADCGAGRAEGRWGVERDELGQVVEDLLSARDAYGYVGQELDWEGEHALDV